MQSNWNASVTKNKMTEEELLPFCECGECGLRVTKLGNRFIHGHHSRLLEIRNKISATTMGHPVSDATKKKLYDIEHANPQTGEDIVRHHYIYNHANPEKYIMKVTRSKHGQIHVWMRKAGIIVPHINITEENKNVFNRIKDMN